MAVQDAGVSARRYASFEGRTARENQSGRRRPSGPGAGRVFFNHCTVYMARGRLQHSDGAQQPLDEIDTVTRRQHDRAVMPSARVPQAPCPRQAHTTPLAVLPYLILRCMSSPSASSAAPARAPVRTRGCTPEAPGQGF